MVDERMSRYDMGVWAMVEWWLRLGEDLCLVGSVAKLWASARVSWGVRSMECRGMAGGLICRGRGAAGESGLGECR